MSTSKPHWTTPGDLRAQVQKWWDRGDLLATLATGAANFPKRLLLKKPTSTDVTRRFDEVRNWIAELRTTPRCRIEMREFTHRVFGSNTLPQSAWIDSLDDALGLIGKTREAARFRNLLELTRQQQPSLLDWMAKRPLRALTLANEWQQLLDVTGWMQHHPRPGIYLRQVDIPGLHSKFIEGHRGVLTEWLDQIMPAETIDARYSGASQFNARYGFRDKPVRIRFRLLQTGSEQKANEFVAASQGNKRRSQSLLLDSLSLQDITLDADSFAALDLPLRRVFITENETNFLAFPPFPAGMVVFGAGYGWDALAQAQWLHRCAVYYWGDIDTHGFAILDQLRSRLPHAASFLMNRATLMAHEAFWGQEPDQVLHDLTRLDAAERAVFDDLRDNRIRKNLRLEQEMVGFGWLKRALARN